MASPTRYNGVAIAIHWLTAVAIVTQFALGWTMISLRPPSYLHFTLHQWHKSIGITILALSVLRLLWRLLHRQPPLPATMPTWEKRVAKLSHVTLYVLLIALPISGWAVVSASPLNIPTLLYGVLPLPHLPVLADLPDEREAQDSLKALHEIGGWILALLLAGHVTAALRHHFLLRDDVLVRMLPRLRPSLPNRS
jgi:cytochrome b561